MKKITLITVMFTWISNYTAQTWTCGDTLTDSRDLKKYTTISIGGQCWMKQNLNYGVTITSNTSTTTHYDMTNNSIAERYAPNGDPANLPYFGALYEWDELMQYSTTAGTQGLCPAGWHVPTDNEWQTMLVAAGVNTVTGVGTNKLKEVGTGFAGGAGTNTSGFSARPAGDRDSYGIFYGLNSRYIFWTSTQTGPGMAYHYTLHAEKDTMERLITQKMTGFACRCVQDGPTGINKNNLKETFHLSPNPANAYVDITLNEITGQYSVELQNLLGETVFKSDRVAGSLKVPVSGISQGVYLVTIVSDGIRTQKKLIVNH